MDSLVKHMRVRFSGIGQEEASSAVKERKLPPQRTQSFKGGKKAWFIRQFSGEMSQDKDLNVNSEYATAIAAAAAAIYSIEESHAPRKMSDGPEISSAKRDITVGRVSRRFSGNEADVDKQTPGESSIMKPEIVRMPEGMIEDQKTPKKAPSIKKTATFADTNLNDTAGRKLPSIKRTPTFADKTAGTKFGTRVDSRSPVYDIVPSGGRQDNLRPRPSGIGGTEADAWERAEMEKINKRHERITSTILSWENEKKAKAKRRMDKIESEIERRRARVLQRYRNDMSRIDQIAGGARAAAEERRRNDEHKTKVKADKIRATGNVPATCFCC